MVIENHYILSKIFNELDLRSLSSVSQVCRFWHATVQNLDWKERLKKDFHFTDKTLITLQNLEGNQDKNCRELYNFCRNNALSASQQALLTCPEFSGIPATILRGRPWFNSLNHVYALKTLMNQDNLSLPDALQKIDGFSDAQVGEVKQAHQVRLDF